MKTLTIVALALMISACGKSPQTDADAVQDEQTTTMTEPAETTRDMAPADNPVERLRAILDGMPEDVQARYQYRNPAETLEFFGIMPGMTVVEALPGGGWYSKILIPYLGSDGTLIGVDYSIDMLRLFGTMSEQRLMEKQSWADDWPAGAREWVSEDAASVEAFVFGNMPEDFAGSADAVLMIRALHNLNRFEPDGGYRTTALQDAYNVLKPGGVLGIVQHEAAEDMPDDWADGSNGYLKKADLIEEVQAAGFEFVGESAININPDDQPTTDDFVWRLPPTLGTSRDDDELRAEMLAIGESSRMTLKFVKPD